MLIRPGVRRKEIACTLVHASRVGGGTSREDRQSIHEHLKNNLTKNKPPMYTVCFLAAGNCSAAVPAGCYACLHQVDIDCMQVAGSTKNRPDVFIRDPMKSLILTVGG